MSTLIPNLTYRVIRMTASPGGDCAYVAVAWNYDYGQLMATHPCASYSAARAALDELVSCRKCALRWFDGEYETVGNGDQIVAVTDPNHSHRA